MLHLERILVPTNDSPGARAAGSYALRLAALIGAQVHFLRVMPLRKDGPEHARLGGWEEKGPTEEAHEAIDVVRVSARAASVPRAVVRYASEREVDMIVMGTRSRNWLNAPIGGVTHAVLRHAPCPVLAVRQALPLRGITRILAPVDFSDAGKDVLRFASRLSEALSARLDVLHVLRDAETASPRSAIAAAAEDHLHNLIEEHVQAGVLASGFVRPGPPAPVIINFALQRHSDLLVVATHGGDVGDRPLLPGSVGESVIRRAPCPALAVRPVAQTTPDLPGVLVSAREKNPVKASSDLAGQALKKPIRASL